MDVLAKKYVEEILRLHGVPISIVSDKNPRFTSQFLGMFVGRHGYQVELQYGLPSADKRSIEAH